MSKNQFKIQAELPDDLPVLEELCARAFGPGRFARSAYRVREGTRPADGLCFTAWQGGKLTGSVRLTPVRVGKAKGALLLGPLLVDPAFTGQGCGRALVVHALDAARSAGYRLVLLVGDLSYYAKFGFQSVPRGQIVFPGPVDPARLLAVELQEDALKACSGPIAAC